MRLLFSLLLTAAFILPARAQDLVARGRYLAVLGDCAGCHTAPHGADYAGGVAFHSQFGTVYSTNITPDPDTGIGKWTAGQFYRALHEGITPDGKHLYPAFPYFYFSRISRADTNALFAYLKTRKPVHQEPTPNQVNFPYDIRAMMIFWDWIYLDTPPPKTPASDSPEWKRGKYLVNSLGHCAACHTPKNILFGDIQSKALTGAVVENWFGANLTGNDVDGLGRWSHEDLVQYLATGRNKYATAAGAMQETITDSTSHMTDADLQAIATYLKSLPPYKPAAQPPAPEAQQMAAGEAVFVQHCKACHLPAKESSRHSPDNLPDYPRFKGNTLVLARDPTTVLRVVLEGAASPVTPNAPISYSMPSFATLTDGKIAAVATYIRNSWGNHASPVPASTVKDLRADIASNR